MLLHSHTKQLTKLSFKVEQTLIIFELSHKEHQFRQCKHPETNLLPAIKAHVTVQ